VFNGFSFQNTPFNFEQLRANIIIINRISFFVPDYLKSSRICNRYRLEKRKNVASDITKWISIIRLRHNISYARRRSFDVWRQVCVKARKIYASVCGRPPPLLRHRGRTLPVKFLGRPKPINVQLVGTTIRSSRDRITRLLWRRSGKEGECVCCGGGRVRNTRTTKRALALLSVSRR